MFGSSTLGFYAQKIRTIKPDGTHIRVFNIISSQVICITVELVKLSVLVTRLYLCE